MERNYVTVTLCIRSFTGHAAKLMKWRRPVSEALDAQSVAILMNEKRALADKDLQSITSKRSEHIEAAERLLDIVSNQPIEYYPYFLDALDASGHHHVRELLETDNIQGTRKNIRYFNVSLCSAVMLTLLLRRTAKPMDNRKIGVCRNSETPEPRGSPQWGRQGKWVKCYSHVFVTSLLLTPRSTATKRRLIHKK